MGGDFRLEVRRSKLYNPRTKGSEQLAKETACRSSEVANGLRISSIPFCRIPGQSELFLRYQSDPASLRHFYPSAVSQISDLKYHVSDVLSGYSVDRAKLAKALLEINTHASPRVLQNIDKLRSADTVAVLTGQQAGLFSGPLYSIYKAFSAVKLAEQLNADGVPAVPIFWVATEDHDFAEVSETWVADASGEPVRIEYRGEPAIEDLPVGAIVLDESIRSTIEDLSAAMRQTEFTADMLHLIESSWRPGKRYGDAFISHLSQILGRYGLIFVDPLSEKIKDLASPILEKAVERAPELVTRLVGRDEELKAAGYHAQVLTERDYFPLFWVTDVGERSAIRRTGEDRYVSKKDGRQFSLADLALIAQEHPQRLSPGVMLRPVVQDFLFPTLCYFGGAAEVAYFAQNSVVYEALGRRITPILHRQSFSIVEPRIGRALESLDLEFCDLLSGFAAVASRVFEETVAPATAKLFAEVEEAINIELNRLDRELSQLDATLAENLAKRRRKIVYHVAAMREKAFAAQLRAHSVADTRLKNAFASLYPKNALQERSVNLATFLNKYGENFIDWLYESVDLDDRGHREIYL